MTRYTNTGRKRTYVEAGFADPPNDDVLTSEAPKPAHQTAEDDPDSASGPSSQPKPKKRKRTKKKKSKPTATTDAVDGEDEGAVSSAPLVEEARQQDQAVKSAYGRANREKLRKDTAVRGELAERRRLKRQQEKLASTTCFACRESGHAARDCPTAKPAGGARAGGRSKSGVGICYRCGSLKHTLSRCKKPSNPDNPLPHATCFVCSARGHLASACPQNAGRGVYPNGGSCKLCGETAHLARDCPLRKQDTSQQPIILVGTGLQSQAGADEDDFHALKRVNAEVDSEERTHARAQAKARKQGAGAVGALTQKPIRSSEPPPVMKAKVVVFK